MAIYRVPLVLGFTGAGSPGANIWHVRTTGNFAANSADLQSMVDAIRTFYDTIKVVLPSAYTINIGTVTEVETANEATPTFAQVGGTAGAGTAPQALAIVCTWRTSIAARRGRGRTFIGPVGTAIMQSDGTIVDASRTVVANAAAALVTASKAFANGAVGVYGLQSPAPEGTTDYASLPHVLRDFQGSQVRDVFGVLRSRRD